MTSKEYSGMAQEIAVRIGAVKGSAYVGTWLEVPGVEITIHLDGKHTGKRYSIHRVGEDADCTINLLKGDGRPGFGPFHFLNIGVADFDVDSIVYRIKNPGSDTQEVSSNG